MFGWFRKRTKRTPFKLDDYVGTGPPEDPWKGFANGQHAADGFVLSCPGVVGKAVPVRVPLQVKTQNNNLPDTDWKVIFLLHRSFETNNPRHAFPTEGTAAEELKQCHGVFTVGVVVFQKVLNGGSATWREAARLELDLQMVPGGPADFYNG